MNKMVIHLIDTIIFRFKKATEHRNDSYYDLSLGKEVRTPLQILDHMLDLTDYTMYILSDAKAGQREHSSWDESATRFIHNLGELKAFLQREMIEDDRIKRVIQGPLSDALTHVGQLAMMSRLNDTPVSKINYSKADLSKS